MHRREDDHQEHRRRGHREDKDDYASKKPRSRWDVDVPKTSEGERSQSSSSRWDDSSGSSSRRSSLNSKSSRWDDKGGSSNVEISSGSRWDSNGKNDLGRSGSSQSRSRDQKSRSRSNSPFRRNDRDYANYSNPSKDERDVTDSKSSPNSFVNHQPTIQNKTSKKYSSWSDSSSDEEEKPRKIDRHIMHDKEGSFHSELGHSRHPEFLGGNNPAKDNVLFKGAKIQGLDDVKLNVTTAPSGPGISLKLGGVSSKPMPLPKVISVSVPVKAAKVASIFNDDDSDEPEDMPPECKMRMKNVGRETKTSEGPNSFGKTKIGFCNLSHLAEKKLDGKLDAKKKP